MSNEVVFTNARIVRRDGVVHGSVKIADGKIGAVDSGNSATGIDLEGDLLLPGLVEMHTDNLEKHIMPRPGVLWPTPLVSVLAHDTQIAGAGITTVFDSIAVGEFAERSMRRRILGMAMEAIRQARQYNLLRGVNGGEKWDHRGGVKRDQARYWSCPRSPREGPARAAACPSHG